MGIPFDLKLGLTNDLVLVDGDLTLTTTRTEIAAQTLGITLKTYRGEWFLNSNFGVPYLQEIIGVAKKKEVVKAVAVKEKAKPKKAAKITIAKSAAKKSKAPTSKKKKAA